MDGAMDGAVDRWSDGWSFPEIAAIFQEPPNCLQKQRLKYFTNHPFHPYCKGYKSTALQEKAKMPWMFLWHTSSTEMENDDHEVAENKDNKKKTKTLGIDLKNLLMSVVPHIEPAVIKYPNSKYEMLSAEEVIQWSQSLAKLLSTQCGQDVFREFLKSEFSDENIDFWLACEDYKKTQSDHLHDKAEKIYKEFVQSDAVKQINIDFHTRKATAQKAQDPTPSSFDEAQKIVYVLMEKDSYPRFLKSRFYLHLLNKAQCNSLK
ncbi:regulator of G-protein signaling 1-like [Eublepharis macularius]|uniref:Regulator of G-protein signaling 1 n=1 Tax=Eublepharis macularius TaxID=481883 RepID=A0AA97JFZ4_EUBMA|nr:regulator of G-protein signaling 1-like [Eublepharis macularius]